MEAKDTVMSPVSICRVIQLDHKWLAVTPWIIDKEKKVAQDQAEISFKAGQDSELEGRAEWGKLMYRAGIKEVVEWIEKNATESIAVKDSDTSQEMDIRAISEDMWQAKLKEWDIKDDN